MKTGILFLAAALLVLAGCALQNQDFGTVGAARPLEPEPLDLGDFSNSYLPPGPAFQNGASVALTQQLIWEAAYDPSVGSPLWQSHGQDASDTRQRGRRAMRRSSGTYGKWRKARSRRPLSPTARCCRSAGFRQEQRLPPRHLPWRESLPFLWEKPQ